MSLMYQKSHLKFYGTKTKYKAYVEGKFDHLFHYIQIYCKDSHNSRTTCFFFFWNINTYILVSISKNLGGDSIVPKNDHKLFVLGVTKHFQVKLL